MKTSYMSRRLVAAGLIFALAACGGLPKHAEVRVEQASMLVFQGGPSGASVVIDGKEVAKLTNKDTTVQIQDGSRQVKVLSGSNTLYERTVFIQDGTKKIIDLRAK